MSVGEEGDKLGFLHVQIYRMVLSLFLCFKVCRNILSYHIRTYDVCISLCVSDFAIAGWRSQEWKDLVCANGISYDQ